MHHHNEVSLLLLSWIETSRVSMPSTWMTPWLSPSSSPTSWCPRSSSTRVAPLTSYIGKHSKGSKSRPPLSTFMSTHSLTVKADQKQAPQCYAESLKVEPYPNTKEPTKASPHNLSPDCLPDCLPNKLGRPIRYRYARWHFWQRPRAYQRARQVAAWTQTWAMYVAQ